MALFSSATALRLPRPDQALPGREAAMPVPEAHFVNGHPLRPPFPTGMQQVVFGMGCFWGAERKFWEAPGSTRPRWVMPAATRRTPPTRKCAPG